jgi:hypothetical protein
MIHGGLFMGTINLRKFTASNHFLPLFVCFLLILFGFSNSIEAQTATKLRILLPGMSAAPGTPSGFTGIPYTQTTGVPFQVIVNATDENWNVVQVSDLVQLTASDPYATLPPVTNLTNGTAILTVTINSSGSHTITADDIPDPNVANGVSPAFEVVEVLYFSIEPDIGYPHGNHPGQVTVGDIIPQVEITARDAQGNQINNYTKEVNLSEYTDYGLGRIFPETILLVNGSWIGNIQVFRAGLKTNGPYVTGDVWVRVNDQSIFGVSNRFCATPRPYSQILNVVPGETYLPGSLTGRSGNPVSQQASVQFNMHVYTTDQYWNQVTQTNTTVGFTSSDPAAVLPINSTLTGGHLIVGITLNTPGTHTITTSDVYNSSIQDGISSPIDVISFGLDHFVFDPISSPKTAGTPFSVTIRAVDSGGNPVTDFSGTLDLNVSTGFQTITPSAIDMVDGVWSGQITLTRAASFVSVTVEDRTSPPHSGTSNQFNVQTGTFTKLQVLMQGETGTPGVAPGKTGTVSPILAGSNISVRVNAIDNWWNVITSVNDQVHLSSSDPNAILPPNSPLYNGTRQFTVTLNSTGLQSVTAQDVTQPSITQNTGTQILVNPGNLHEFLFSPIVGPITAGIPLTITITAVDPSGNRLMDYSGSLTLSASTGTGTISPVNITMNQGLYTGHVTLTKAAAGVFLNVTDGAANPHTGTSNQFQVVPGAIAQFQVLVPGIVATPGLSPGYSGTPNDQRSGQPFPIQVNGVDTHWNVVTTASDSFGVSSTDLTASLPANTNLVNGIRSLSITLNSAGSHTVSAYQLNNPQIANGQSPSINIIPQNLDHFAFETIPSPVNAGVSLSVTIRAETNLNQIVGNFTGMVHLTASTGDGTVLPDQVGPFVGGEWTGSITLTKASGNVSITASDDVLPPHTGTSNLISVIPGAFEKLQVLLPGENQQPGIAPGKSGVPEDQLTGVQFDFRVRAVDEYWNLITSAADSIEIITTDPLAQLPNKSKLNNGLATLSVIMGTVGTHTISASDISNVGINGDMSSGFLVNPGELDHFNFEIISDQTAGDDFQVQINSADGAGNPLTGYNGHARLQSSTGLGTITPTEIDFVDGYWAGMVTITRAANNVKITCLDYAAVPHTGESNFFNVGPGTFTRLQILLPGEQSTPGIAPGKTGTIPTQMVGDAVNITVNGVDNWWNPVTDAVATIELTSTDVNANIPLNAPLAAGTVTFSTFRFNTSGNWTVTANCVNNPQISSDTSPLVHVISGSVASFVFDPISSPQFAGDSLQLSVFAVDGNGNVVTGYNEQASMTASTGPGTIIVGDIQFTSGQWSGSVVLTKAAQSVHINIHDFNDIVRGNSNPFTLSPGALEKLKIIVPGETLTPGLATAITGYPSPQTIGVTFQVTVYATDEWYNPLIPDSLKLHFTSTDPAAVLPADTVQSTSSNSYDVTLLTTGSNQIFVETLEAPLLSDSSSSFNMLTGQVHHFVFSQIDSSQTAGNAFQVRIEAHNQNNFILLDYEGEVILSASTGNGTLSQTGVTISSGFWEGELTITKADTAVVLYAADYIPAPNTHTGYSNTFSVVPEQLAGLQVLLPGEKATPGVSPGKKDPTLTQTAGQSFDVLIRAVDPYWNLVQDCSDTLNLAVSDSFAVFPDTVNLINGEAKIPVILRAATKHRFESTFLNKSGMPVAYSDSVQVDPNNFTQLLVLLPGEAMLPGDTENDPLKTPGRQHTATRQTSGLAFPVEVYAVDDYWNLVSGAPNDQVRLYTTDNTAQVVPINSTMLQGKTSFSVTLNQGGNQIIRAIDNSNSNIRTSLDAQLEVLVGGLHYEVFLDSSRVAAGDEFNMQILFKNGNNEIVITANHLVSLSVVDASTLNPVTGNLKFVSVNLENGQRTIAQTCDAVGLIRIKVEDQINTAPGYSEPLEIYAGSVENIVLEAPKNEIRALEKLVITANLTDITGNPVPDKLVNFSVINGNGNLADTTAVSDASGTVQIEFSAGRVTEMNTIRASVDSVYSDLEIIVNLTPSSLPNGKPINYPNPFGVESAVTYIDYYLAEDAEVTLRIFDLFGNLVWSERFAAGSPGGMGRERSVFPNHVPWDGRNDNGQKVGNGGYILIAKAIANGRTIMDAHRKIAVVR